MEGTELEGMELEGKEGQQTNEQATFVRRSSRRLGVGIA